MQKSQNLESVSKELLEYARYVLGLKIFELRPPEDAIHSNYHGLEPGARISSIVIDRHHQFQTELFTLSPGITKVESHLHDGVDSIELPFAGEFIFQAFDTKYDYKAQGQMVAENAYVVVPEDCPHGGEFKNGGSFFSFQQWKKETPTTVGNSFQLTKGDL